ncbi:MAG: GAF domain-containing protein [Acidobacteriia bacterium]|nr:GAF domain-containing protein [Terriglobia bacterium]
MEPLGTKAAFDSPEFRPSGRERRRRVRMKVHTPAYARMNGSSSGPLPDLSEILDISEDGMCLQTASPLQSGRDLNMSLDLSESNQHISLTGSVIWTDRLGRAGISFPQMPDVSLRQLKEWLFVNAMAACMNAAAERPRQESREETNLEPAALKEGVEPPVPPDYTSILAGLAAVKREVESLGVNLDRALQLVAERAQGFTHATGSAIALVEGTEMICRATAGDAPGLGARLQIGSGFSGECVRTGILLRCEDAETDPRVDQESCRMLGIRSMIAVPIRLGDAVIGLLEVFAPQPNAFSQNDDTVLQRLAETILAVVNRAARAGMAQSRPVKPPAQPVDEETSRETSSEGEAAVPDRPASSLLRKIVLLMAALTLFLVVVWLVSPWVRFMTGVPRASAPARSAPQAAPKPPVTVADVSNLEGLRKLAEQGDAAAQFAMGARYATGEEVKQDYTEAVRWFALAAEQGHVNAQAMLGAYYGVGRGVPQDFSKAYFWSILAQAGGDEASKYRIPLLVSHMSRAQVIAAQQQANEWLKQHQIASKPAPGIR